MGGHGVRRTNLNTFRLCPTYLTMARTMKKVQPVFVQVGPQGRIVIPAHLRRLLRIESGEELLVRVEDGRLIFEKRERILERVKSWFAQVPPEVSLADELIAERRREVRWE